MAVSAAPIVVDPVEPPYGWYIIGMGIAIIAVLIVGIVLILKKINTQR
jgi:hypothetical protein